MRVLCINTADVKGGAAIVANRLRYTLEKEHAVQCLSLVGKKTQDNDMVLQTRGPLGEWIEKNIDRTTRLLGLQYQFFPFSSAAIIATIKHFKPDVIHIHNTHGGYFQTDLLEKISTYGPIVWTLHDMWSFSGNAAHTFDDHSWRTLQNSNHLTKIYPSIGINTGAWLLKQKKSTYKKSNITLVTPSRWLEKIAKESPVFEDKEVLHIKNGIDLNAFRPRSKAALRKSLDLPVDEPVIMFSAEFMKNNPWKGGVDLLTILSLVNENTQTKIHMVVTGEGEINWENSFSNLVIHKTGYMASEELMAQYLSACDVFLYPTRADNLPNSLIEAIGCGTPCVTFDVGGCSEIIVDNVNGRVITNNNYHAAAQAVLDLLLNPEKLQGFSVNARSYAEENFSLHSMGQSYHALFSSLAIKLT